MPILGVEVTLHRSQKVLIELEILRKIY
jgi:hypothetical protein